jgi:hypothetical protein
MVDVNCDTKDFMVDTKDTKDMEYFTQLMDLIKDESQNAK